MLNQETIKLFQERFWVEPAANLVVYEYKSLVFSVPDLHKVDYVSLGLPKIAIQQFQELCRKKGIELDDIEATREAQNFLNFFKVVNGQRPVLSLGRDLYES